jgi:membrane protein insertase Oxa1/YidC/SpoIIIJ
LWAEEIDILSENVRRLTLIVLGESLSSGSWGTAYTGSWGTAYPKCFSMVRVLMTPPPPTFIDDQKNMEALQIVYNPATTHTR